jgi:hypothetical protein
MEPDRQPNPQLPVHAPIAGCWIVLPGILSMLGHLICVSLVLAKWESLEDLNGGPFNFTRFVDSLPTDDALGLSWFSVFVPSWIAELVVVGMAIWLLPRTVRNLRILHINTIAQSMLCALFQLLSQAFDKAGAAEEAQAFLVRHLAALEGAGELRAQLLALIGDARQMHLQLVAPLHREHVLGTHLLGLASWTAPLALAGARCGGLVRLQHAAAGRTVARTCRAFGAARHCCRRCRRHARAAAAAAVS